LQALSNTLAGPIPVPGHILTRLASQTSKGKYGVATALTQIGN